MKNPLFPALLSVVLLTSSCGTIQDMLPGSSVRTTENSPREKTEISAPSPEEESLSRDRKPASENETGSLPSEKGAAGLMPYTMAEVEAGFLFTPLEDVASPVVLARGFYHLTPPLREEDRWSLKIAYRRRGSGEAYRYEDQSRLIDKEPVKVIRDSRSPHEMREFALLNQDFQPGDTIEYYYILTCEATGQSFSLQKEPPQSYTIAALSRDPEKMFALEPIPFVPPGQDFDSWLIAGYGAADLNLKDWRGEVHYRIGNEPAWRKVDAPPVPDGFDCTIPTRSLPSGTRVAYYIRLINTGTGEELLYRNAENPLTFRMGR